MICKHCLITVDGSIKEQIIHPASCFKLRPLYFSLKQIITTGLT
jgi:hypothetical protein